MLEFRHILFKRYFKTTPLSFYDVITNFCLTYPIEQKYSHRLPNYIPFWIIITENVENILNHSQINDTFNILHAPISF